MNTLDVELLEKRYVGQLVKMLSGGWTSIDEDNVQDFWINDTGRIISIDPMQENCSYAWNIEFDKDSLEKRPRKFRISSTSWNEFEVLDDMHPIDFLKEQTVNADGRSIYVGRPHEDYKLLGTRVVLDSDKRYCFLQALNQPNIKQFFAIYSENGNPEIEVDDFDHCIGLLLPWEEVDLDWVRFDNEVDAIAYMNEQNGAAQ